MSSTPGAFPVLDGALDPLHRATAQENQAAMEALVVDLKRRLIKAAQVCAHVTAVQID